MKYKGILLDIDNTIYDYNESHSIAKDLVIGFCRNRFNISRISLEEAYFYARKCVHIELAETASSHNRLLYFQRMLELLSLNPLESSFDIYNVYWDSFLENMKPFEGAYMFLKKYKQKICLVTDLTAHIQYRKVLKLNLQKYCSHIITSEEAGREKPHPIMFKFALDKLKLNKHEVCMIGDSFKKDIIGASNLGIKSIWMNHEDKKEAFNTELITEVKSFEEIMELV